MFMKREAQDEYSVRKRGPLCPNPKKGTPLVSPGLKPGVLRGGGDNTVSITLQNIAHLKGRPGSI